MSDYPSYLIHYGIQGQKWGERRFQNEDGTYTPEGLERRRSGYGSDKDNEKLFKQVSKAGKYNKSLEDDIKRKYFKTYHSKDVRHYNNKIANVRYKKNQIFKKASKNKAMEEALKDEKLIEAYNKAKNTHVKYYEPDFDTILEKVSNKYLKSGERVSSENNPEKYYKILRKADEQYNKEYKKYEELYKKDPWKLAMDEYNSEVTRVAKNLAAEHANDKIGDITYQKHLESIIKRYGHRYT